MNIIIFIFLAILILPTAYACILAAPPVPTRKKALKQIFKMAKIKPGQKVYDLGSGTGRILIRADKLYQAQAIGFELSVPFYLFSKFNIFFNKAQNTRIYFKNFYKQDLSQADLVFCFLTPFAMKKLALKFQNELKSQAKIISFVFQIPDWQAKEIFRHKRFGPIFLYEKK